MNVQVRDGREFKVRIVHGAPETALNAAPGSLRQVVEDLGFSLQRRCTLVEIGEADELSVVTDDDTGALVRVTNTVAYGFAVCYKKDQYNRRTGRLLALFRALLRLNESDEVKDDICRAVTNDEFSWIELVGELQKY